MDRIEMPGQMIWRLLSPLDTIPIDTASRHPFRTGKRSWVRRLAE
ncbi:MAG: hypothetical protein ACLFSU_01830 [Acholeplasmataceae bacterium]